MLISALLPLGCQGQTSSTEAPLNAVVILVDTLRADRLGPWGVERETSPNLTAMAEGSVVFADAVSPARWTVPSVVSVLSGVHVQTHRCCDVSTGDFVLHEALTTLPEVLQAAGYHTAGYSKSGPVNFTAGIEQGFTDFEGIPGADRAQGLTDHALLALETIPVEQPFFMYLHYMDPHTNYRAPDGWHEMWAGQTDSTVEGTDATLEAYLSGEQVPTGADVERLMALYDEEIAYWDSDLSRIFYALEARGLMDSTVLIVISDHGEQFGEHGSWGHRALNQENIHVPWIMRIPGEAPQRIEAPVQLVDLAPTLAGVLGVAPASTWQGQDLRPLLAGEPIESVDRLIGQQSHALIRPDGLKLHTDGPQLFDLSVDPGELDDLSLSQPEDLAEMQSALDALLEECSALADELQLTAP